LQKRVNVAELLIISGADHQLLNNNGKKPGDLAPEPIRSRMNEIIIRCLMENHKRNHDLIPGICVFCLSEEATMLFGPCPHIELCDVCYLKYKDDLKQCPTCGKTIKRVKVRPQVTE